MKRDQKVKTPYQIITDRINAVQSKISIANATKRKWEFKGATSFFHNNIIALNCAKLEELRLLQTKMPDKVYEIELHEWDWNCGDGCCTMYGLETTINGEELFDQTMDRTIHLKEVLAHLGIKANVTWKDI